MAFENNPSLVPGPNNYYIKKALHGTYHQGNEKLGETAGIQCASNAFYAICFSVLKNVSTWAYSDLDCIIGQGDNLMKCLGVPKPLAIDELPLSVKLKGCDLEVTMLQHYSNRFSKFDLFIDHKELSSTEAGNGAIFTYAGISFALIWGSKSVCLFDSHSRNSEDFHDPNGLSVLLEFSSFTFLNNFILKYFEEPFNNSACLQHYILDMEVEVVNNVDFVMSSNHLLKLNDVSHNNAEIPAEKPFLHEAVDKHEFQINYSFKKSVSETYHQ